MLKLKPNFNYFLVPISLSIVLIVISLMPLPKLPEVKFVASDKLGHLFAFFLLILTYLWAFSRTEVKRYSFRRSTFFSFLICLFIGGAIELLQHFLPIKRLGDWYDFYFDIAGIIIGIMTFKIAFKKQFLSVLAFLLFIQLGFSQDLTSSLEFQKELDREFGDPIDSPLDSVDRVEFKALDFYPIDEKYIVEASLIRENSPIFFELETTTSRRPEYRVWGIATFTLNDVECSLTIYQSKKLMNTLEYGDYLFLPYSDLTNGESTYDGGRYVDLKIVEGDVITIDFNKSYNPYCAYSNRFSCPKVPSGNSLKTKVEAGVKKFH